jgi:formate dehydrogenase
MTERTIYTHCMICEQLCGLEAVVADDRVKSIRPDKKNPYTWRDFCVKGQQSYEVAASPWRVKSPMRRVGDRYIEASYEEAVEDIATRLQAIIARHGKDAVAGYLGNPMGFSSGAAAYHFGFLASIGTSQRYGVQSIDSNAKHVACDHMFGLDTLALIPDIDATDYALLIGTNPAVSKFNWGGKVPNGWRRLKDRAKAGATIVVVDPRRTETAAGATQHVAAMPETDWAFLLGVIKIVLDDGLERLPPDLAVAGLDGLRDITDTVTVDQLAAICDIATQDIVDVARGFASARRAFAFAGTGPALARHGVLTHWLTLALNILTNRIDREGGRFAPNWPYNLPMANASKEPKRKSRVRGIETVVGQHSLAELADEISTPGAGQIHALIIGGGNPVSTGAGGGKLAKALEELELLVSVDLFQRESHRAAHWLIPAVHFLEREEVHVALHSYNDRPFIQTTRQVVAPPSGVRPEWMFYRDLALAMGKAVFGGHVANPDEMAAGMIARAGNITLGDVRAAPHGLFYGERTMGHLVEFFRKKGRAVQLCPPKLEAELRTALAGDRLIGRPPAGSYRIISRRRNGMMNASLAETSGSVGNDETAETIELNRNDAEAAGIADGDWLDVRSETGSLRTRAKLSDAVRHGTAVLAQGWGSPLFDPSTSTEIFRRGQDRNKLVSDTDIDPLAAVPRLNGTLVKLTLLHDVAA